MVRGPIRSTPGIMEQIAAMVAPVKSTSRQAGEGAVLGLKEDNRDRASFARADRLPGVPGVVEPGREAVNPLFGRNADHVPEKLLSLPAGLGISDHKDHGDAKAAREEGVHFELAHELPVQTEGVDVLAEEG